MENKKYQVFVSSTYGDLIDERRAVMEQIQSLGHIAAGMEAFSSSDDSAWDVITKVIDDSDYYVLILKHRYGSLDENGISWTEREYDYAFEKGLPVLAFVPAGQPEKVSSVDVDSAAVEKLAKFRAKVEQRHTRTPWKTSDELKAEVVTGLSKAFFTSPRDGWVRAGALEESSQLLNQLNELRIEKDDLLKRLRNFESIHGEVPTQYARGSDPVEIMFKQAEDAEPESVETNWGDLFLVIAPQCLLGVDEDQLEYVIAKRLPVEEPESCCIAEMASIIRQFMALGLIHLVVEHLPLAADNTVTGRIKASLSLGYRTVERYFLSDSGKRKYFDATAAKRPS